METENKVPESVPELLKLLRENKVPESKFAENVRWFLDTKAREQGVPYYGHFELTPLCNLDCKMCYVHLNKDQMGNTKHLPLEDWFKIFDAAAEMGMMGCQLTGGECLIYPDFDEIYLHLQDLGVEIDVYTNGILLDEQRIEFFKAHPPKSIQISLYGSCEDGYENVTGHRKFQRVMNNIEKAKAADLPISLAIAPSTFMGEDVEKVIRLAHSTGVHYRINWSLFDPRENTGRKGQEQELSVDDYVRFYKLSAGLRGIKPIPVEMSELPDFGGNQKGRGKGLYCGGGRSSFSMGYDGKMYICGMVREAFAEPLKTGFKEAWEFINNEAENYPVPMECIGCKYRGECPVCVAQHQKRAEKGHADPFICERTKRMAAEGLIHIEKIGSVKLK